MEGLIALLVICVVALVAAFVTNVIRVDQALQEEINVLRTNVNALNVYCTRRVTELETEIENLKASTPRLDELPFTVM